MSATIVAAVDDSPASLQAARLLAGYRGDARQLGIVALNVQTRPLALWPRPGVDPARIESALLAQGARHLEPACKLLAEAGLEPVKVVRVGVPADCIADEAMRRGATAIVMGTRGKGAVGGFAVGSVALRVAHRAQTPVVLVQPDTRLPAALGERVRVLVPLDGSAQATRAVHHLLACRDFLGALSLELLHVRPAHTLWEELQQSDLGLLEQWGSEEAERATRDARALLHMAGIDQRLHETQGDPAEEIVRFAGVLECELIVMGTRGLGALHHALIGSVALKVAHASPVPVVLVP